MIRIAREEGVSMWMRGVTMTSTRGLMITSTQVRQFCKTKISQEYRSANKTFLSWAHDFCFAYRLLVMIKLRKLYFGVGMDYLQIRCPLKKRSSLHPFCHLLTFYHSSVDISRTTSLRISHQVSWRYVEEQQDSKATKISNEWIKCNWTNLSL